MRFCETLSHEIRTQDCNENHVFSTYTVEQMNPRSALSILLDQAAKGDRHSFGKFYELYLKEIYRYIYFRVYSHDEAEDLTTKVFLEAWESLTSKPRDQKIENIRAWIYRIAHNKVIDYRRTRKIHMPIENNPDKNLQVAGLESHMDDLFLSQRLAGSIRRLPANYQQIIILRFINQLSHAEVAEIMQITESHVRVLQHRALLLMRAMISEVASE
jgi:RNA polymerase sigma-70 factor (ECF subfamily)